MQYLHLIVYTKKEGKKKIQIFKEKSALIVTSTAIKRHPINEKFYRKSQLVIIKKFPKKPKKIHR